MRIRACWLLCAAAIPALAQPDGAPLTRELQELQGVWRLRGFEIDGQEALLQEHKQVRWVIKGDKVFYGGEEWARVTLDPAASPRCLDLRRVQSGRVHEGIY